VAPVAAYVEPDADRLAIVDELICLARRPKTSGILTAPNIRSLDSPFGAKRLDFGVRELQPIA
jgi:hypothetical protein